MPIMIRSEETLEKNAREIADKILNNLKDRKLGIDSLDDDILLEIKNEMIETIKKGMK